MKYLITGGCGFVGSNLAAEVLKRGEELVVFDNLMRHGSSKNLEWLSNKGKFKFYPNDIRNANDVELAVMNERPDVVFHLAGQVAMTSSISNPRLDFEVNVLGTFNLLDSLRKHSADSIILYSSSNKVYGDFNNLTFVETAMRYVCREYPNGIDETVPLDFHSPYGCSKGAADQYLLDFSRIYGLRSVVFRHSSMFGGNQHATVDQGWVGWFCHLALENQNGNRRPFTISGSGKQVRDVLHSDDVVSLYFACVDNIENVKGNAFNIGGGVENSLSLLELFDFLDEVLNIDLRYNHLPPRESDQLSFIADNSKIMNLIDWRPKIGKEEGITKTLKWLVEQ